jgi:hypothetical protein
MAGYDCVRNPWRQHVASVHVEAAAPLPWSRASQGTGSVSSRTAARAAGRSQPGRRQIRGVLMQVAGFHSSYMPFARDHSVRDALIDHGTSA